MKKFIFILIVFTTTLFTSCEKEVLTPEPNFSDVTWYASTPINVAQPVTIPAGKVISIFDLSQGDLSHEWQIIEGSYFLKPGFDNRNAAPFPDLTPYIDDTKGLSTTDKTIHVYFPTAGNYTITLKNTFKEKVIYNGATQVEAVLIDGVWVFEQTFNIVVN